MYLTIREMPYWPKHHRYDIMPNNNRGHAALAVHVSETKNTPDFENAIF